MSRAGGTAWEVFTVFLKLGLSSFGGPIAHLGYFREELVVRRRWIDDAGYANLLALCQFLPGPASSQVGFSLGVLRANGLLGGLAAWLAFTLPSALILYGFAIGAAHIDTPWAAGVLHGLKLVAVAVVAQAVLAMVRTLTPDLTRAAIAIAALILIVWAGGSAGQVAAMGLGAVAGIALCRQQQPIAASGPLRVAVSKRAGMFALVVFAVLFAASALLAGHERLQLIAVFNAFYHSGALVFGGGHVVLPLLATQVVEPGWISEQTFLTGYGLAQAVPGPLFTIAAYLGAMIQGVPRELGALVAVVALALPGLLLVYGTLPFWEKLQSRAWAQAAMRGTNAAVVGVLAAALYDPIWTSAIGSPLDFALAAVGLLLLSVAKWPPWIVVLALAAGGAAST